MEKNPTQPTHMVIEAWGVRNDTLRTPQNLLRPTVALLDQLGASPHREVLHHHFEQTATGFEEAASLLVATHQAEEKLRGFVGIHSWPEHRYVHVEFKDEAANPYDVLNAFNESFQPEGIIGGRPPDKLAHLVTYMTVPNRQWHTPVTGRSHLLDIHDELITRLDLHRFGKPRIWGVEMDDKSVIGADGLMESHLVTEIKRLPDSEHHSLAKVVLFTCTGRDQILNAPQVMKELYQAAEEPLVYEVGYYNQDRRGIIQTAQMPGILARVIPNPQMRTVERRAIVGDFQTRQLREGSLSYQVPYLGTS